MALKDWSLPTSSFPLPGGGEIAVRGVSAEQVAALVREDRDTLRAIYAQVTDRDDVQQVAQAVETGEETPDVAGLDMPDVANELLNTAPQLVAKVIAWAAGEPDQVEAARQIPMPSQLEILVEIGRLTFETTSPGKFLEAVIAIARAGNAGLASARQIQHG